MNKTGISVIICTYNGEMQLTNTLKHLINQNDLEKIEWEIILVDNNSSDGTGKLIKDYAKENIKVDLKTFFEPSPGKLSALKLGIRNASYKYLLICDDDNWLNQNYVITAYKFMESHPEVGVLGGKGSPVDLGSLPNWILPHLHNYAAAEQCTNSGDITHDIGSVYGAGMVIRKEIYDLVFEQDWPLYLSAMRSGKVLLSGEDTEICYIARLLGYKIYYNANLEFKHNFPLSKINETYLLNLVYFFGFGTAILSPYIEIENKFLKTRDTNIFLELYRLLRYDLFPLLKSRKLTQRKKLYFRYGFIKGLILNQKQIKNLKTYLKQKIKSASASPYIE